MVPQRGPYLEVLRCKMEVIMPTTQLLKLKYAAQKKYLNSHLMHYILEQRKFCPNIAELFEKYFVLMERRRLCYASQTVVYGCVI